MVNKIKENIFIYYTKVRKKVRNTRKSTRNPKRNIEIKIQI